MKSQGCAICILCAIFKLLISRENSVLRGAAIIKLTAVVLPCRNKLECLPLSATSTLVGERLGAKPQ